MDKEIGELWRKPSPETENDATGFSEKQLDIKMDIQAGTWQDLKTSSPAHQDAEQKVLQMYKTVSQELVSAVLRHFEEKATDPKKVTQRLREIRELRLAQDSLLNFLIDNKKKETDLKGELEHLKLVVPKDLWIS